jgi:hypothetical protein
MFKKIVLSRSEPTEQCADELHLVELERDIFFNDTQEASFWTDFRYLSRLSVRRFLISPKASYVFSIN